MNALRKTTLVGLVLGVGIAGFTGAAVSQDVGTIQAVIQQDFHGPVNVTARTTGQALVWGGTAWIASTVSGGGGGSQTFAQTLAIGHVSGGTSVVMSLGDGLAFNGGTPVANTIRFGTGGGSVTHILGPSDQTLRVQGGASQSLFLIAGGHSISLVNGSSMAYIAAAGQSQSFQTGGVNRVLIDLAGNVVLNDTGSALSTSATDGFTWLPTCAGTPTGTPGNPTGASPVVLDTTGSKLWAYIGSSWTNLSSGSTPGLASVLGVTSTTGGHNITFTANDAILGSGSGGSSGITAFSMTCRIDGTPFVVDSIGTQLGIVDTTAWAKGVGGGIGFYGLHGPSSPADYGIYGSITGVKSSAVSGEQGGQVSLSTVNNSSVVMLETLRATNDQRTWCCPTASDLGGRLQVDGKVVVSTDLSANILSIDTVGAGTTAGVGGGIGFGFKYDASNYTFSAGVSGVKENNSSGDYSTALKFITRSLTLNSSNFTEQGRFTSAGSLNLGGITTVGARGDIRTISQFQVYNNVATAGTGVEVIYGAQNVTGQSGAGTICTYTPAADGTFEVSAQLNVTAATALTTTIAVTYHDVANNARTLVLPVQLTGGTAGTYLSTGTITASGAADFSTATATIRVKAGTSITTATTSGTFTGVTYSASGSIRQSLQ